MAITLPVRIDSMEASATRTASSPSRAVTTGAARPSITSMKCASSA